MGFFEQVYAVVRRIPKGRVVTYGQIAQFLGKPRMSRQVGWALHANTDPENIPCRRVVNRSGRCAAGFAGGGELKQRELLEKEGIVFEKDGSISLEKYRWRIKI
ncbi:methylated-DNA--[protein]-cysteine S-methyltransferase [Candidatus Woesearchaeota archaeon]|nr:methylated-DNA--[protein]-cysteine S-methyltransferase [Candidatus Woesearchaeota archaeon]